MKIPFKQKFIFASMTISAILVADLTITLLNKYIMTFRDRFDIHIVTLIGMLVVLLLFYVLVTNIEKLSDWAVRVFVKIGRRYLGRSIGLYFVLALLWCAIYAGYYWAWFDRSLPSESWRWFSGLFAWLG
ncbi:MAG: hypothetical protein ACRCUT_08510 [Spirochaetota bacterium]